MSYQRNVMNKLGLPIARHCGPDRRNVFLRLMPTPGYGFIFPKRHVVRTFPQVTECQHHLCAGGVSSIERRASVERDHSAC